MSSKIKKIVVLDDDLLSISGFLKGVSNYIPERVVFTKLAPWHAHLRSDFCEVGSTLLVLDIHLPEVRQLDELGIKMSCNSASAGLSIAKYFLRHHDDNVDHANRFYNVPIYFVTALTVRDELDELYRSIRGNLPPIAKKDLNTDLQEFVRYVRSLT
jgi:hypothetical protein